MLFASDEDHYRRFLEIVHIRIVKKQNFFENGSKFCGNGKFQVSLKGEMMEFKFVGVNEAFEKLVDYFTSNPRYEKTLTRSSSRVGDVIQVNEPVTVKFLNPLQRVLFNVARDCNPFFHVYETLWMLAGRRDIAPLQYYSSGYAKQVQDGDNPYANGAYGYRWRHSEYVDDCNASPGDVPWAEVDQLRVIIDELKKDPTSRRCVLQMWNVKDDLLKISKGPNYSKDVCCNTAAYFSIRHDTSLSTSVCSPSMMVLDMTVTNRSNDLIWGTLGSDVVNLSFLQEYVANCLGIPVGVYNQFTNNLHVYTDRFTPDKWMQGSVHNLYQVDDKSRHVPLVRDQAIFDEEVQTFVRINDGFSFGSSWREPFLQKVAQPMCDAFHHHKQRNYKSAMEKIAKIEADDWKYAASLWIAKRSFAWETK